VGAPAGVRPKVTFPQLHERKQIEAITVEAVRILEMIAEPKPQDLRLTQLAPDRTDPQRIGKGLR